MGNNAKKSDVGFFQNLFGGLFKSSDPEAEKKRVLRNIAKQLSKSKYKFYKLNQNQALPAMAKYFFDIYKAISPAQALLSSPQVQSALKNCIIDYMLSDKQKESLARLSEEEIEKMAQNLSVKEVTMQVKTDLNTVVSGFDSAKVAKVDIINSQFQQFLSFVTFDYYFLLKKFDTALGEREFSRTPNFQAVRVDYVLEDLKDFISVAWSFPAKSDWSLLFAFIKSYKQTDPMSYNVWTKVLNRINDLKLSQTLEGIIRYSTNNPEYEPVLHKLSHGVVDSYLEKLRIQSEAIVRRIAREKANTKTDSLLKQLFGSAEVVKLKNYTTKANEYFEKRSLPRYKYCAPLNYMKVFLVDYFKCDVRNVHDLVVVRGKWFDPELSKQVSDAYNNILQASDKITALDDSLGDSVDRGNKIKALSTRADRDKAVIGQLQASLKNVNNEAFTILKGCSQELVIFAKFLKSLIEDVDRPKNEILTNWKEVQHASDDPLKNVLIAVYKKIYLFISLMQMYLAENAE